VEAQTGIGNICWGEMFGKCRENAAIPNPIPRTQDGDAPRNGGGFASIQIMHKNV